MARLNTTSKSSRPTLLSAQSPLVATPAPTAQSSLSAAYAAQLQRNGSRDVTPSRGQPIGRSKTMATLSTPRQTPSQFSGATPNLSSAQFGNMEAVDLTGDDDMFMDDTYTEGFEWNTQHKTEGSARPSLQSRGTKRKSGEMTRESSPGKEKKRHQSADGFMDIDELFSEPPKTRSGRAPSPMQVATTEDEDDVPMGDVDYDFDDDEQYFHDAHPEPAPVPITSSTLPPHKVPRSQNSIKQSQPLSPVSSSRSNEMRSPPRKISVKRERSPEKLPPPRSATSSARQSPTRASKRRDRVIPDSDNTDDDMDIMEEVKRMPTRPISSAADLPPHSIVRQTSHGETTISRSTRLSPLRETLVNLPIKSLSAQIKSESYASPLQRDSPTKLASKTPATTSRSRPQSSGLTPSSTPGTEDKALVAQFLDDASFAEHYASYLAEQDEETKQVITDYIMDNEAVPPSAKERRKQLVAQKKAFDELGALKKEHSDLMEEKKARSAEYFAALDSMEDEDNCEHNLHLVTGSLRELETRMARTLRSAGMAAETMPTSQFATVRTPKEEDRSAAFNSRHSIIQQTQSSISRVHEPSPCLKKRPIPAQQTRPSAPLAPLPARVPALPPQPSRVTFEVESDYGSDIDLGGAVIEPIVKPKPAHIAFDNDEEDYGWNDEDDEALLQAESFDRSHTSVSAPEPPWTDLSAARTPKKTKGKLNANSDMSLPVNNGSASLMRHKWSADVKKKLTERFHLRGFRQNQLEAINATLSGKDAFVLMPTGGGKSLCYQLPAIIQSGNTRGVTIVISPLLSLMYDQVEHLKKLKIQAFVLNSEVSAQAKREIYSSLRGNRPEQFVELLYVTPEMVSANPAFVDVAAGLHKNGKLARIVIDEAHCVSQWGHDFRPDYTKLGEFRERFAGVPLIALTATATENVKVDVIHNLGMKGCEVLTQSFNRPNLVYTVLAKNKKAEMMNKIVDLVTNKYRGQTGIIYTLSRKNCEVLANELWEKHGVQAVFYHASLKPEDKKQVQADWQAGKWQVIVATIAFGMGIDKSNVRFVIHHTMPKSLEGYYQETGRAGRDGKLSGCYLFYGYQDTMILRKFIDDGEGGRDQKERLHSMLNRMVQYCEDKVECRRVQVLGYFGERFSKDDCNGTCDNCNSKSTYETVDRSDEAKAAINIIQNRDGQDYTVVLVGDIMRGVKSQKVQSLGMEESRYFGVAKHLKKNECESLIYRLIGEHAFKEDNKTNKKGFTAAYIKPGAACRDFLQGKRKLTVVTKVTSPKGTPVPVKKASSTGVAAARMPPPSTNISSPIRGKRRNRFIDDEAEETDAAPESSNYAMHSSDVGFIVPDGHISYDEEEDDEYFEPLRDKRSVNRGTRQLGPPIQDDMQMVEHNLPEIHQMLIQEFVDQAKRIDENIRNKNGRKKPMFNERNFREMCIGWTMTLDDLKKIKDIDQGMASKYGMKFIPLIRQFNERYTEMMDAQAGERDMDHNHENVIDLLSDSDVSEDEGAEGDEQLEEASAFFQSQTRDRETQAFNERLALAQSSQRDDEVMERSGPAPYRPQATQAAGKGSRGGKGGSRGRGGGFSRARKPAVASAPRASTSGSGARRPATTQGSTVRKSSGGTSGGGNSAAGSKRPSGQSLPLERRDGGNQSSIMASFAKKPGPPSGIGMMPTR